MIPAFCQTQHVQYFLYILCIGLAVIQQDRENDILFYRQFRDKLKRLKDKTDIPAPENGPLFLFHGMQIVSFNHHAAGAWSIQRANAVEQCAFSGTGFAHNRYKIPLFQSKRDILQCVYPCFALAICFA